MCAVCLYQLFNGNVGNFEAVLETYLEMENNLGGGKEAYWKNSIFCGDEYRMSPILKVNKKVFDLHWHFS